MGIGRQVLPSRSRRRAGGRSGWRTCNRQHDDAAGARLFDPLREQLTEPVPPEVRLALLRIRTPEGDQG